jgi:uncharacterized protein involved in exopolysaccharide biosynthesis/Mrp family chromosome partitioning ATPase
MDQSLNIVDLIRGIWARKLLVVMIFAIIMSAVAFIVTTAKERYTPQLNIIVEGDDNPYTRIEENRTAAQVTDQEIISQVQVVLSHDLANRVASELNLAQYAEFDSMIDGLSLKRRIMIMLGLASDPSELTVDQRVLDAYYDKVNVYQVSTSRVITVEFTSADAQLAADVANAIGETYVLATREVKFDVARDAMLWLTAEITRLRQKVADSEAAVEEFRATSGLLGSETETLNAQELSGINGQIILASAARTEAQARAQAIREQLQRTGGVDSSTDVLNSAVVQRLREQQVELQRQVADLSTTFLSSHPRMQSLNAEIENLARQIRSEALKIVEALEEESSVQGAREAALRASLAALVTRESDNNQEAITLRALEREATANRDLLQTFLERFSEASARQDLFALPAGARIISRAQVLGEPTYPKKGPMIFLGLAAAFALSLLVGFVAEVFSPSVVSQQAAVPRPQTAPAFGADPYADVTTGAVGSAPLTAEPTIPDPASLAMAEEPLPELGPVLQEFPPTGAESGGLIEASSEAVRDPLSNFSVAVRRLTQKFRDERHESGTQRFLWTCADTTGDKTVILANIARSFALAGTKTVIVDADIHSRNLAQVFQLGAGPGLAELVGGEVSFADVIVKDTLTGAHVMRLGGSGDTVAQVLESPRVGYILDALDHAYELVLINIGPVSSPAEEALARQVPYAIIVAHGTRQGERAAARVQQMLTAAGAGKVATVRVQSAGVFDRLLSRHRKAA